MAMKQWNVRMTPELNEWLEHKRDDESVNVAAMIRKMVADARDREIKGGMYSTAAFEVVSDEESKS